MGKIQHGWTLFIVSILTMAISSTAISRSQSYDDSNKKRERSKSSPSPIPMTTPTPITLPKPSSTPISTPTPSTTPSASPQTVDFPAPAAPMSPNTETFRVRKPTTHMYDMYLQEQVADGEWVTRAEPGQKTYDVINEIGNIYTFRIVYLETRNGENIEHYSLPLTVGALNFETPETCATCHPRQFTEWSTSTMAYSAVSPTFNTLEHIGNMLEDENGVTGRFAAHNDANTSSNNDGTALFCQNCHTPVGIQQNEFIPFAENTNLNNGIPKPSVDLLSDISKHGVSCDVCHQIQDHKINIINSTIDDGAGDNLGGVGNSSFEFIADSRNPLGQHIKFGPLANEELTAVPPHDTEQSAYLSNSKFCASCHDVRINGEDTLTGESFRRLENLFTEWEASPWSDADHPDNPVGEIVSCQGCHMSTFPEGAPNQYAEGLVATTSTEPRKISNHYFTGVDLPLIDFPGIDITRDRRKALLTQAVTVDVNIDNNARTENVLPIQVELENVGAGHNIPAGFSQERQFWIKLDVIDANNQIIYESGYLRDSDGDGLIHDEDLNNFANMPLDESLEVIGIAEKGFDLHDFYGDDVNQRNFEGAEFKNLGLINFGNEFIRTTYQPHEEVFSPFAATAMENTHSLPPLEKKTFLYDVELDQVDLTAPISYPLSVNVSLHFRPFPPRFLQGLVNANIKHQLNLPGMDDTLLDKNEIIDMAATSISVAPLPTPTPIPTATPSPTPTPVTTPSPKPTATPSPTSTPTPQPRPTATPQPRRSDRDRDRDRNR